MNFYVVYDQNNKIGYVIYTYTYVYISFTVFSIIFNFNKTTLNVEYD